VVGNCAWEWYKKERPGGSGALKLYRLKFGLGVNHVYKSRVLVAKIYTTFQYGLQIGKVECPASEAADVVVSLSLFVGGYLLLGEHHDGFA